MGEWVNWPMVPVGVAQVVNTAAAVLMGGLWRACFQGVLLFGAVWLICRLMPRLPARTRFALWWLVCAKLVIGLALCVVALPLPLLPTRASGVPVGLRWLRRFAPPARIVNAPRAIYHVPSHSEPADGVVAPRASVAPAVSSDSTPTRPSASPATSAPLSLASLLAALYTVGVLLAVTGALRDTLRVRRLLRTAVLTYALDAEALEVARTIGLRRAPRIAVSEAFLAPLVTGIFRPRIVLPASFAEQSSEAERRMALAHEMAHLHHGDLWLGLVPATARVLFFFLPPVYAATRECAACREEACDLAAVAATGAPAAGYARLLLGMIARQRQSSVSSSSAAPALGMASPATLGLMKRRLRTLQSAAGRPVPRALRAVALLLVGVSALGILPWRLTASARPSGATGGPEAAPDDTPLFEITDLGTLGGKYSDAFSLNDDGEVVGTANVYPLGGMGHAFLYRDGVMQDLSEGSLYRHSLAFAVNSSGKVAASAYRSSYRATALNAFLWNGKRRVYLGSLPGFSYSKAVGINGRDAVVGNALTGGMDATGAMVSRAFLWESGRIRDLGTLGGPHSHAYAVNDAGQVVGKADLPADSRERSATHAFLYEAGMMRDLGTLPGGMNSLATAVNQRGIVVGFSQTTAGTPRAFRWESGIMRPLDAADEMEANSVAYGVNDAGQVVGQRSGDDPDTPRATLWLPDRTSNGEGTRTLDLNERLTANPDGWHLETARAINSCGQIVGRGIVHGQSHAFLLTPVAPRSIQ